MLLIFRHLDPMIQGHLICALVALVLGPVVVLRRRRDVWHRWLGRVWVAAMAGAALSSFGITGLSGMITIGGISPLGPFSPIHLLSVYLLWGLWSGVAAIRRRDVVRHRQVMLALYTQALLIAGALTFWPGRTLSRAFAPEAPWLALGLALLAALAAGVALRRHGIRARLDPSVRP